MFFVIKKNVAIRNTYAYLGIRYTVQIFPGKLLINMSMELLKAVLCALLLRKVINGS
jgi:hypothetical protein